MVDFLLKYFSYMPPFFFFCYTTSHVACDKCFCCYFRALEFYIICYVQKYAFWHQHDYYFVDLPCLVACRQGVGNVILTLAMLENENVGKKNALCLVIDYFDV